MISDSIINQVCLVYGSDAFPGRMRTALEATGAIFLTDEERKAAAASIHFGQIHSLHGGIPRAKEAAASAREKIEIRP